MNSAAINIPSIHVFLWTDARRYLKSDRKRQILYDLTYMWILKGRTHRNKEKNDVCQGLGSEGNGEVLAKEYKIIKGPVIR